MEELPNLPLTGNAVQSQLTSLRFLLKHAGLLTVVSSLAFCFILATTT